VFAAGFGMMAAGLVLLAWVGYGMPGGTGIGPVVGGIGLGAAIVLYNRRHKDNPASPVLMGLCRVLVYVTAGLAVAHELPPELQVGALLLLCYLIGLTYIAKQETLARVENLWPLAFLAVPVLYGAWLIAPAPLVAPFWVLFCGWMALALWLLRRRRRGDIPRAVVSLIAGISLLDALLIAASGLPGLALAALAGFGVTLFFQRYIAGT
jgi:4-hydroxybenzoate polyprenyltransferase